MTNLSKTSARLWLTSLAFVLLLPGLTVQAQNSVTNGVVAYWNFDNRDFKDSVGKFDGTGHGKAPIAFVPGKLGFGQAIQLDGVDEFVEITGRDASYNANDLATAGGSISIAGWFTVGSFDKSWQALIAKGGGNSWRVQRYDDNPTLSYAGGINEGPNDGPDVTDGNWHHFAAISDAKAVRFGTCIYINGVQTSVNPDTPVLEVDPFLEGERKNTMIGDNPRDTGRYWNGKVDDLAIWNRVLTESEIKALYAEGTGKPLSAFLAPPITVTIARSGNQITLQWSPTGGMLESTPILGPTATWTAVGTTNPVSIRIGIASGFYRVQQ